MFAIAVNRIVQVAMVIINVITLGVTIQSESVNCDFVQHDITNLS
jgi:hypothetical protein